MIIVETTINAPIDRVWTLWTDPEHIRHWNFASDDWHAPAAVNDVTLNGRFRFTMAAKDKSAQFDFEGTYTKVTEYKEIGYVIDDGRNVLVTFSPDGTGTRIVETFEAETLNSEEAQQAGWQAILDNFKRYAEEGSDRPV